MAWRRLPGLKTARPVASYAFGNTSAIIVRREPRSPLTLTCKTVASITKAFVKRRQARVGEPD